MVVEYDEYIFVKCGRVLRHNGSEEGAVYMVNGMLFTECEEGDKNNKEIEKWGDGKYYKRVLLGSEKKLKNKNDELTSENEDLKSELEECREHERKLNGKEGIRVLKHMETLNGDYSEYIRHANKDDIKHIMSCCELFKKGKYKYTGEKGNLSKCTGNERKSDLMFLKPIKKEFEKVMDPDMARIEKHENFSHPQVGHGIFTLLASTILPALVSLFKKMK